jgi:hypothetical protein
MEARMAGDTDRSVDVTIRIEKSQSDRLDEIVRALKAAGLRKVETHDRFGVVNGEVSAAGMDGLRAVAGVASVREDKSYRTQE